ncbi:MAG: hypothetical protein FJZ86_13810 [Chloroflexi bacterium]|nr:hypothetical protein [Chloroflexota bacterium]
MRLFLEKLPLWERTLCRQQGVLLYKMIARDLLGCTGPFDKLRAGWWDSPPFSSISRKRGFEFFLWRQGAIHARLSVQTGPPASNLSADRQAQTVRRITLRASKI